MTIATGDQVLKLEEKRNLFLSLVRRTPGISRQECARLMRVSTFYASKLVPELIAQGMIFESGNPEPGGGRGRPVIPLHINPVYEYFAGIDLEASAWRFAITDFQGDPVFTRTKAFKACADRDEYLTQLEQLYRETVKEAGTLWSKVSGLGIGSPGFLDQESGIIETYEILPEFNRIPLLDLYKLLSRKPTFIRQNINHLATYDLLKRPEAERQSVIHMALRSGISAALTINGAVYEGAHNRAGEAGLFLLPQYGMLQDSAGLNALKRALPELPDLFWQGDAAAVSKALRRKKNREILHSACRLIAMVLANLAAFIDPDMIIVYCSLFREDNKLWHLLNDEFKKCRGAQTMSLPLPFCRSDRPEFMEAVGAAIFALENVYPTGTALNAQR